MLLAKRLTYSLLIATAVASSAYADTRADKRQASQEKRIDQGVQSGALTRREARRLERGQANVERLESKAQADGTVTNAEKLRIEKAQDVQSKRIYREKHDAQVKPQQ
jgi:uncharacterized membrane protein YebE (DUF533 family)